MTILALAALFLAAPSADAATDCWQAEWCRPATPFRIVGNVYYVGTEGLSAFLVTDPKGHVLIEGGLPRSAAQIAANVRALGFRIEDVRYLLVDHAHFDHMGGLAELKRLSGAKLVAGVKDAADLEAGKALIRPEQPSVPPVHVDRTVGEGDVLTLGATRLVSHATPGHTAGATSWTMTTIEGGKPVTVIFASSLTVAGLKLEGNAGYPSAMADFRSSFAKLRSIKVDVFLSAHPGTFGMAAKQARLAGDPLAFVDPTELRRTVDSAERDFQAALAEQRQPKAQ
ncbi:subclass B3 metallo-beta-lactamase [Sphingomonas tabacisoli]|uniref:Subclass B3 metallo-beta-lactamase n=1 Tax=Sphingomonas tabacisoli TaxID=2249466 RepID=A0ABW4I3C3_9SPHN